MVRSVRAKIGRFRALPDNGMKICTGFICGLQYNFRRVTTKSRSRARAEKSF